MFTHPSLIEDGRESIFDVCAAYLVETFRHVQKLVKEDLDSRNPFLPVLSKRIDQQGTDSKMDPVGEPNTIWRRPNTS